MPDLLRQLPELRVDLKAESTLRIIRGSCQSKRQLPERQLPEFRSSCQNKRQLPDPLRCPDLIYLFVQDFWSESGQKESEAISISTISSDKKKDHTTVFCHYKTVDFFRPISDLSN